MSHSSAEAVPYQVVDSERVRHRFQSMAQISRDRGDRHDFVSALQEVQRLLSLYPQFGEPLSDLVGEVGQNWIGFVRPIAIRYSVLEERRIVFVTQLPVLLRKGDSPS